MKKNTSGKKLLVHVTCVFGLKLDSEAMPSFLPKPTYCFHELFPPAVSSVVIGHLIVVGHTFCFRSSHSLQWHADGILYIITGCALHVPCS